MKVYFAYRTGYQPNNRFIKEFEADGILDFFQKYWNKFTADDYKEFLGTDIYSFPIQKYDGENDTAIIPAIPQSMTELTDELYACLYVNDLQSSDDYIEVWTDDDEIELIWCVFTETYKNQNMDKLAIWFYENLPTQINCNGDFELGVKLPQINIGNSDECCYLIANTIYDSENSEGIASIQIKGTNLIDLVKNIKSVKINDGYGFDVLKLIKAISIKDDADDVNQVLANFVKYDLSLIGDFEKLEPKNDTDFAKVMLGQHIAELCVVSMGCFYNYYVIFDNHWANSYPELAKSLIDFGMNWQFVESDDDDDE